MENQSKPQKKRKDIQKEEPEKVNVDTKPMANPIQPEFIPWIKADIETKIDRLHFVLKDIIKAMNAEQRKTDKIEAKFYNHKHVDNQLMQIISQFEAPDKEEKDTRKPEEIWF